VCRGSRNDQYDRGVERSTRGEEKLHELARTDRASHLNEEMK
jgi:hypothetical protein